MSFTENAVNMNGSDDPSYRYKMPALAVKHEGSSKMKKTVISNLNEVSRAVGRPAEYLLTYLGQSLSAASKIEKEGAKMYIAGHHDPNIMQKHAITFIQEFVMCKKCSNPETSCMVKGSKKNKELLLDCKSCGARSHFESDKFVKYMVQHLPQDTVQGHAQVGRGATTEAVAAVSKLADAEREERSEKKKEKRKCPSCGHNSSKDVCSKCGMTMDTEVRATNSSSTKFFHSTVESWVDDHKSTPLDDQLSGVIQIVADEVVKESTSTEHKLQPVLVSKMASSVVQKWSSVITDICNKFDSSLALMDIITVSIVKAAAGHLITCTERTKETIVIGVLLCLRDHIDAITDDGILSGCRRLPSCGEAMRKFMQFLESQSENESDAD